MKTILSLALLCFAINAHGATYLLLSQTNAFAKGITNEAKAYTDAHSGGGIVGTVSNNVASAGLLAVDATKTNGIAATKAHITNAWNIFDGDTLKFVNGAGALSAPAGGGNVVNSGASVVGMIPVYTDVSGTAVTPTNSVDLTGINVGTLYLSNMVANVVPVFDGNTNLVPSTTSTNDLNAIAGKATVLSHYMGTDTNALLSAIGGVPNTTAGVTNAIGTFNGSASSYLGGDAAMHTVPSGTVGTMVSSGSFAAGDYPKASDTTGTNFIASLFNEASTTVTVKTNFVVKGNSAAGALAAFVVNTNALIVTNSGVGIGKVPSSSYALDVSGALQVSSDVVSSGGSLLSVGNARIGTPAANYWYWTSGSKIYGGEDRGWRLTDSTSVSDRIRVVGTAKALSSGNPVNIVLITTATNTFAGGKVIYTVAAKDASDDGQVESGEVKYAAYDKLGTTTCSLYTNAVQVVTSGTLSTVWAYTTTSNTNLILTLNATTSLTPSSFTITYEVFNNGNTTHSQIIPQ